MIRVTIELWPFGDKTKARILGVMDVWNNASGDRKSGNYNYCAWKAGTPKDLPHNRRTISSAKWAGQVTKFPRQKLLVWDLLYRCLKVSFGARNKD